MLTEEAHLKQVLPPGTVTWQRHESKSTLDLIFLSPLLQESLLECRKSTSSDSHSDHEPIRTVILLSTIKAKPHQIRNWNKTDTSLLRQKLDGELRESSTLYPDMSGSWDNTNQGFDSQIEAIISAIQNTIHASTPWVKISPRSRPGFTPECKEAQLNAKKLKRRWRKLGTKEAWEAFREARNNKARIIKKTMKLQYRTETENACDSPINMWKRCKWSRNRTPREACMPALHSHTPRMPESCPKAEAEILINRFFPPPPTVDLSNIETLLNYLPSYHTGKITVHEIRSTILGSISKKVPGEDGIPNLILKLLIDSLLPHLSDLQQMPRYWILSYAFSVFNYSSSSQTWEARLYHSQSIPPHCSAQHAWESS